MKQAAIRVGGYYLAKVSNVLTTVRVDAIGEAGAFGRNGTRRLRYEVTNLRTGRKTTFRSAVRFWSEVREKPCPQCKRPVPIGEDHPFGMHSACYARSNAARLTPKAESTST